MRHRGEEELLPARGRGPLWPLQKAHFGPRYSVVDQDARGARRGDGEAACDLF
jgi:hypothetical protein